MITTILNKSYNTTSHQKGFTLIEVIIAMSLGLLILSSVLTSTLLVARSSLSLVTYVDLETKARRATELFARDAREASHITGITSASDRNNITSLTFTIPRTTPEVIYYNYDPSSKTLFRTVNGSKTALLDSVISVKFTPYKIHDPAKPNNFSVSDAETAQIQLNLLARKTSIFQATNTIISAKYILRNRDKLN